MDEERQWMVLTGDAKRVLKALPNESVNTCVTSPPYYGLRSYYPDGVRMRDDAPAWVTDEFKKRGTNVYHRNEIPDDLIRFFEPAEIGLEESPEEYISNLADVFDEVKRVLRKDGTCWLNIGDSYWGSGSRGTDFTEYFSDSDSKQATNKGTIDMSNIPKLTGNCGVYKNKDLIGIPWMLAFELRKRGWYLRQDIIWQKVNPLPESVKDRCTKSHEYIFLLSKSQNYYFDHEAMQERAVKDAVSSSGKTTRYGGNKYTATPDVFYRTKSGGAYDYTGFRNKRDVWSVPTQPFHGAHFATFPEQLIEPCVRAGSPVGGVVLDPFSGSGTTGVVCLKNDRRYIGIELNPEYVEIQENRIGEVQEQVEAKKNQFTFFEDPEQDLVAAGCQKQESLW